MAKYNIVVTTVFELESDKPPYDAVMEEAKSMFDSCFTPRPEMRTTIKIDKKKTVLRNIMIGIFKLSDVLPYITKENTRRIYTVDGIDYPVRMNSQRYFVFNTNPKCICCGIEGTKMILEQHPAHLSPHFNLYAEEGGKLVLMTKDHIQAKANGGGDIYSNYQSMCSVCNNLKGAANLTLDGLQHLRKVYEANKHITSRKRLAVVLEDARNQLTVAQPRGLGTEPPVTIRTPGVKVAIAAVDLYLWRQADGKIVAKSVYEIEVPHSELIGSIRRGLYQEIFGVSIGGIFAIQTADGKLFYVYEGHLKVLDQIHG